MPKKLHFLIIGDINACEGYKKILEDSGYNVTLVNSNPSIPPEISQIKPDCIIYDIGLSEPDKIQGYQELRKVVFAKKPIYVVISGRCFEFNNKSNLKLGVDGYLTKPIQPESFVSDLLEIIQGRMVVQFWGVRGTLPVPGKKSMRYGGNTNCVTLSFAKKDLFIFDAGTGIKELSNYLMKQNHFPLSAKIFITHPHYDHINGIPFFVPLYMEGNDFEVFGTSHSDIGIEKLLADQMDSIYFPITMNEFSAKLKFHDLTEESFKIDDLQIKTIILNHPGKCIGFRVQHRNRSFCYITDNELYLEDSPQYQQEVMDKLIHFIKDANLVVMDATYSDEEYSKKSGWGHSCISRVVDLADKAKVKKLCLYHHDPDQSDSDIDKKLQFAKDLLKQRQSKTRCVAPREGDKILI